MFCRLALIGICYLAVIVVSAKKPKLDIVVMITDMKDCDDVKSLKNTYENVKLIHVERGKVLISADFVFREEADKLSVVYTVTKCKAAASSNCEHFIRVAVPDLCPKIVEKGQFWSPLFANIHPPMVYPLKKGVYKRINATYDTSKLVDLAKTIPGAETYFWKLKMMWIALPSKKEYFCIVTTVKALMLKAKKST